MNALMDITPPTSPIPIFIDETPPEPVTEPRMPSRQELITMAFRDEVIPLEAMVRYGLATEQQVSDKVDEILARYE